MEGRNSPSRGLDIAAEYIAAQFRRAGLEPVGDNGYFQTVRLATIEPNMDGFEMQLTSGDRSLTVSAKEVAVAANGAVGRKNEPIFKIDLADQAQVEGLTPVQLAGKVVFMELGRANQGALRTVVGKLQVAKPAALVVVSRTGQQQAARRAPLSDPGESGENAPRITVSGKAAGEFFDALKPGESGATASIRLAEPHKTEVTPKNVIGILRGSDPALKDTYVFLTAHYDHLGMRPEGTEGDRIFNGANDDGSGTVSVMEVARALGAMKPRPRRSIVFMTFCCEEEGTVGSRYYAHHPLLPLAKTVAQLNLEQVGRTDDSEGPQVGTASVTGFDYSTLPPMVQAAGEVTGVKIYKHPRNSDIYFFASDNGPMAQAGVPAHTLSVSFQFPDYHRVGDEWQKIDYDNMARIDRTVTLAIIGIANSEQAPQWDEKNAKADRYRKAREAER